MKSPEDCATMTDLRVQIDELDTQLVDMLAKRTLFIDRAAELKPAEGLPARITSRVEEVAANARRNALDSGFDPDLAERIWRLLMEWSIAREEVVLGPSDERKSA